MFNSGRLKIFSDEEHTKDADSISSFEERGAGEVRWGWGESSMQWVTFSGHTRAAGAPSRSQEAGTPAASPTCMAES